MASAMTDVRRNPRSYETPWWTGSSKNRYQTIAGAFGREGLDIRHCLSAKGPKAAFTSATLITVDREVSTPQERNSAPGTESSEILRRSSIALFTDGH